jgi:acyl-CoA dehydrogenase
VSAPATVDADERAARDAFRASVRRFVAREIAPHVDSWDEAGSTFPRELYRKRRRRAARPRLPRAPRRHAGRSLVRLIATEEIARAGSGGLMASLFSHNIGLPPIVAHGSAALQERIVPDVLAGRKIAALAITEPGAGSDVARIACRARRDGDAWIVDGEKTFITSGVRADWLTVAVRTGVRVRPAFRCLVPGGVGPQHPLPRWAGGAAILVLASLTYRVSADHLIGARTPVFARSWITSTASGC